ncbi:nuclear transport factor 2 family protein [Halovenus rubra]|uniref:Nuclear transport factor 2 family protein n=2 Tax=Halovenus rubra TaxID=869890 RepID=A0ABD5X955_9EURY|nr:nuclear transport factor 2 family protein [Halovenus rubra]
MSSTPAATVREYYELVDAGRYDTLVELFATDVRYERPGQDVIEGQDSLRQFYFDERPLDDGSHTLHDVVVNDETVAVRGQFTGIQNGESVSFEFADFHEFADGKIHRRYTFTDRDEV